MNQKRDPVGVFDSGIGGISTLREMIRELPEERFVYFGDTANAPYGTKSTDEVITCVRGVVNHLPQRLGHRLAYHYERDLHNAKATRSGT